MKSRSKSSDGNAEKGISLGVLQIDKGAAWTRAKRANTNLIRTLIEFVENAVDAVKRHDTSHSYDGTVVVRIEGKVSSKTKKDKKYGGKISIDKFIIEDNGVGMSHDDVMERFRDVGKYNELHDLPDTIGKEGQGVASGHHFFEDIRVDTTTDGIIPMEWRCEESRRDFIEKTYNQCSELQRGDNDAEERHYRFGSEMDDSEAFKFTKTPEEEHKTVITLSKPLRTVSIYAEDLKRLLSHRIQFLSKFGNRIVLYLPSSRSPIIINDPFYTVQPNIPRMVTIKGSFRDGLSIIRYDESGEPIVDEKCELKALSEYGKDDPDLNVYLVQYYSHEGLEGKRFCDWAESICGSNLNDSWQDPDRVTSRMAEILEVGGISNSGSINTRIRGAVWSNDIRLKKDALVSNRDRLDQNENITRRYQYFVAKLLMFCGNEYQKYAQKKGVIESTRVIEILQAKLAKILLGNNGGTGGEKAGSGKKKKDGVSYENKHSLYCCGNCRIRWKTDKKVIPTVCCEGCIKGQGGCGSSDVASFNPFGKYGVSLQWQEEPIEGTYMPCKVSVSKDHEVSCVLWLNHPEFLASKFNEEGKKHSNVYAIANKYRDEFRYAYICALEKQDKLINTNARILKKQYWDLSVTIRGIIEGTMKKKKINLKELLIADD